MKTIIVPTDFSEMAENITRFAVDMAGHINASVLFLNVYQLPVAVNEAPLVMITPDEMKAESDKQLFDLKDRIEALGGNIKIYTESRMGDVVGELKELCETIHPFAVIMGMERSGKLERTLFGSNTLAAIRNLEVPVLVIPPGAQFKPVQKIGLACDFKDVLPIPGKEIRNVVSTFHAELYVLNVDHSDKLFSPDIPAQSALLHNMIADLKPHYHFIDKEDIEEGLNEFARQNNIDFLIVIPKKHQLLEKLFHTSHTKGLALHAEVPVMAIHE